MAIAYSDGVAEFRDRTTLQTLPLDDMPDKVTGLCQIGFRFGVDEPCKLHLTQLIRMRVSHAQQVSTWPCRRIGV